MNRNPDKWQSMLTGLKARPPAPEMAVARVEAELGFQLPSDYRAFMLAHDGGEGNVGPNYLALWRVEDLPSANREIDVARFAPGFLIFGSDGGGEAFAFDMRPGPHSVVMLPFVALNERDAVRLAPSFMEFLVRMSEAEPL